MEVQNFKARGPLQLIQIDNLCVIGSEEEILKSLLIAGFVTQNSEYIMLERHKFFSMLKARCIKI